MKTKLGKTRKRLEEAKKKKISQDKRVSHLRSDIAKSEKSFDRIEQEIRKEIERQFENESKKEEIERRIKIFEVENAGISDEFGKLLVTLTQESDVREKSAEQRLGELQVMMTKGMKYLENLDQKIEKTRKMDWANQKNARIDRPGNQKLGIGNPSKRRSKSETSATKSWRRLEDLKKQIIQLKRESEALRNNRIKLIEEKDTLQKTMEACQRQADRAAQELRNAENFRISELTQQQRKLQPSILIETRVEKQNKNDVEKREKLREKVELLEKSREEKKEELERIIRRSDYLRRQLRSHSETDLVQFENDKTEKAAELRDLKKTYHEQVMMLNALNRKLQQRVFQREAAMTKANSVVHITTNVREERNREMEELRKEMAETRKKF
uniref:Uncharacterized protein n=1 Tax=Caenorhabditis japonica TaxID=281687 RepID=A0A8R1EA27_CAEJA